MCTYCIFWLSNSFQQGRMIVTYKKKWKWEKEFKEIRNDSMQLKSGIFMFF